mgnify:CR=1 FL=1
MDNEEQKKEETADVSPVAESGVADAKPSPLKFKYFFAGLGSILVILGVLGIVFSVRSFKNLSDAPWVLKVADVLNVSVAKVNGVPVSYARYMEDLNTLKKFYSVPREGVTAPTNDEKISDQVLSRLIVNSMVKDFARQFGITISGDEVNDVKAKLLANCSSEEEALKELKDQYGWDLDDYVDKVVKPILLEQKVADSFANGKFGDLGKEYESGEEVKAGHILFRVDDGSTGSPQVKDADAKKKAEEVLERAKNGEDFAALAQEFGSDATKDQGGDLGWFGRGAMVPEFEEAVFALQPGQVGDTLVKTQFGYHIVKLDDRRVSRDFVAFINDKIFNANIELLGKVHDPFTGFKEEYQKQKEQENQPEDENAEDVELPDEEASETQQ